MTARLCVVLPGDVADPSAPSGGNVYGLRVCQELAAAHGWDVRRADLDGTWPRPGPAARARLTGTLAALPDGATVLVDGLVAGGVPEILEPAARRLRLAVLVHLPLADETGLEPALAAELATREQATLRAAHAVVVTSPAAARALRGRGLPAERIHVAAPGVDPAPLAAGTDGAHGLLCVASLTPRKGQDLLLDALAELADRPWTLVCAGPLHRAPTYVEALRATLARHGLTERVLLAGPLGGAALQARYDAADLAVLVSWTETYGMVVTEALARGIPVLATRAGALPDTLGHAPDGSRPGLLVPPGDATELVAALRRWFDDATLRYRLRTAAHARRVILPGWEQTARSVHQVLDRLRRTPLEPPC
ncbi:MAG TPA: glycosyltransferase family 4 protein [Pseudonocardia sp.]|nr:glycosyltransferase family 4 protein [Pseudonocardia sp.]